MAPRCAMILALVLGGCSDSHRRHAARSDVAEPPIDAGATDADAALDAAIVERDARASDADAQTCIDCLEREVELSMPISQEIAPTFRVSGCDTFTVEGPGGWTCSTTIPGCGATGHSVDELRRALLHPDVVQALDDGARLGGPGPLLLRITVDDHGFEVQGCISIEADCQPAPAQGVTELIALLDALRAQQWCNPSDCDLPFDPGTGDQGVAVFWHDPDSRACLARSYGGTGGNGNRFASAATCEASCPGPTQASDCPPDRMLFGSACLECDPSGGCGRSSGGICLKPCANNADCELETAFEQSECQQDGTCVLSGCM